MSLPSSSWIPGSIVVQSVEAISAKAFFMRGLTFSYNALFFRESKIMFLCYVLSVSAFPGRRSISAAADKVNKNFYFNKAAKKHYIWYCNVLPNRPRFGFEPIRFFRTFNKK